MNREATVLNFLKEMGGEMELCCNERVATERGAKVRQADVDPANKALFEATGIKRWTDLRMVLDELDRSEAIHTVRREISQMMEITITDEGRRMAEVLKHGRDVLSEACRVSPYRRKYDRIQLEVKLAADGTHQLRLIVEPGKAIWLIGRNGSGKTTLVNNIAACWRATASEVPMVVEASRSTKMHGMGGTGQSGLTPSADRRGELGVVRISGEQDELGRLLHEVERQQKARQERMLLYGRANLDAEAGACLRELETALEATNRVLKKASLHYRIARRQNGSYQVEGPPMRAVGSLSDGERAALQMTLAVLNQGDGTLIVLDEPDKHLSADTARDVISALREERRNSCFILATHCDVEWDIREGDQVYEVKRVRWRSGDAAWEVEETSRDVGLGKLAGVIRRDQRPTVLVEGTKASRDRAMYETLLPTWRVIPRQSATDVQRDVARINETMDVHGCKVRGIVDGDGRPEAGKWIADGGETWVLPQHSIENIYWSQTALAPVIEALAKLRGVAPDALIAKVRDALGATGDGTAAMWEKLEAWPLKRRGSKVRARAAKALGRPVREIEDMVLAEVRRNPLVQERLRTKTGLATWAEAGMAAPDDEERGNGSSDPAETKEEAPRTKQRIPRVLYQWTPDRAGHVGRLEVGVSSPSGYTYAQVITRSQREIIVTFPSVLIGEEVTLWAGPAGSPGDRVAITRPFAVGIDELEIACGGTVTLEWMIHEAGS